MPSLHELGFKDINVIGWWALMAPVGTGPFKLAEFKRNETIRLVKNPDYWKKGLPYLDGIEFTIMPDRATRMLSFIAGKFDMTFPADVTVPSGGPHQAAGSSTSPSA